MTQDDRASIQAGLIACLIFVILDFLRGKYTSGLVHLSSGLQVLQQSIVRRERGRSRLLCSINAGTTDYWLFETFFRIQLQARLLGAAVEPVLHGEWEKAHSRV